MLDVTGNNIANVNTTAFKASATQFQDTLSQMTQGAGAGSQLAGGTNAAQIGLGVRVAGISTNFSQGSAQATGKSTDMMISGDGFFAVQVGDETLYSRAGAFNFDSTGRLVTPDGGLVQGWTASGGVVPVGGPVSGIVLPQNSVAAAIATTTSTVTGNLPADAAVGDVLTRDQEIYDSVGATRTLSMSFTRTAAGWDVVGSDGASTGTTSLVYTGGALTSGGSMSVGAVTVDLTSTTGYAKLVTVAGTAQNGRSSGTLQSYSMGPDGTLVGSYSNGTTEAIARIALATFTNPGGLEKAGSSDFRTSVNSGVATLGIAGTGSLGTILSGSLEMSNVDLSQEFTNLIVAQRGFQANARIITTSDEVLQELTNLKR
jgi:flagellar hook protein FlgE